MDFQDFNFDDILGDFIKDSPTGTGPEPKENREKAAGPDSPVSDAAEKRKDPEQQPQLRTEDREVSHRNRIPDPDEDSFREEPDPEPEQRKRRVISEEIEDAAEEEPVHSRRGEHHGSDRQSRTSRSSGGSENSRAAKAAARKAEKEAEREAKDNERREERRRKIIEKKADQRLIEQQRLAAEREREDAREYRIQERADAKARDVEGRRKSAIGSIIFILVIALLVGGFLVTAKTVNNSPTTMPNLYAGSIAVGGMTDFEMEQQLAMSGWDQQAATPLTVTIPGGISFMVDPVSAGMMLPSQQIVQKAMEYGKTGNMFTTMFNYIECLFKPLDINDANTVTNSDYIQQQIDHAQQLLTEHVGTEPYTLDYDAGELRAVKGAGNLELEPVGLMGSIVSALRNGQKQLDYQVVKNEPQMPDFNALHAQIYAEVKDAKYSDDGRFDVIDDTVGCDFDVNEAVRIWNETPVAGTAVIPLKVTKPAVTGEELRSRLYNDVLGEMTTYFPNSTDERINNVALCSAKVDGTVLYSGDVFSYNATVGERTEEAGFKPAAAYSSGEVVEEIGGGACQVSSTIYCATLYARMETVERTCHQFEVAYMDQLGLDATVSWPEPDFKFRNNKQYPVRIDVICDTEARSITARIMGTKEDDYTVELKTDKYQYINNDGNWVGWRTLTYRILRDKDGNIVKVPDQYGNMVDYEYTNQIIEATGKPGMDTYLFH